MAHYDETFSNVKFVTEQVKGVEFDGCRFKSCSFESCRLDQSNFVDCHFSDCNFAMAQTNETGLKEVRFENCKLVGLDFSSCTDFLFRVEFVNCQLDFALFTKKNLRQTPFRNCSIREADFSGTNLTAATFAGCDLAGAQFESCIFEKTDFRSAQNFTIDPNRNRMKGARFSRFSLAGLLQNYGLTIE
ncbi:pentapeptide repeat-containing protein [Mangrovibacterium sp.]|uniref:pentapeptide repeat-containing protein n=1 Tax=Mangrovibacterium sp. TaxID=1961364 RepID=UPI003565E898